MPHPGTKPWSMKWLVRSLLAGAVFLALMLFAFFGPPFAQSSLVFQASGACLALCLIVAAVAFVFEVVHRVTSV